MMSELDTVQELVPSFKLPKTMDMAIAWTTMYYLPLCMAMAVIRIIHMAYQLQKVSSFNSSSCLP